MDASADADVADGGEAELTAAIAGAGVLPGVGGCAGIDTLVRSPDVDGREQATTVISAE
jgi:hypothetical protein